MVESWTDPAVVLAGHYDLCYFVGRIIGDRESYKLLGFVQIIDGLQRGSKRDRTIRSVEVEDIHTIGSKFLEGDVNLFCQVLRGVRLRFGWVEFRG